MPLNIAPIGEDVKIVKLHIEPELKKHFNNLGLLVGEKIQVIASNQGSLILMLKNGRLALNEDLAMKIHVE